MTLLEKALLLFAALVALALAALFLSLHRLWRIVNKLNRWQVRG